jgi:hypothetical protein
MPLISCPNGHQIRVTDRHLGQPVKCPTCEASFVANAAEPQGNEFDVGSQPTRSAPRGGVGLLGGGGITGLVSNFVAKPLVFVGLLLAILGRGCDATSMRAAARTDAQYRQNKVPFDIEWAAKISTAQQSRNKKNQQIDELNEKMFKKGGAPDQDFQNLQKQMETLQNQRNELDKEVRKLQIESSNALIEKENGEWKPAHEAALSASNHHRMWGFWFEMVFIFGTMVLVVGVLTLAFTATQPAERWVAYILMSILAVSIYIGGFAWVESITTSMDSGSRINNPYPRYEDKGGFK